MVEDLEAMLAAQGRLPHLPGDVPVSPHELSAHAAVQTDRAGKDPGNA
jgi:hypothetical protein